MENKEKTRQIEICASFSGKISNGNYENSSPFYSLKEMCEGLTDEEIKARHAELHTMCYDLFQSTARTLAAERIMKDRQDIRFYSFAGKQYPSVTSILNWDADYTISQEELAQYGAQGTITHARINHYINTGKWVDAKTLPECYKYLVILEKGSLKLPVECGNFPAFLEKYPINFTNTEMTVVNTELEYAGRYDAEGIIVETIDWNKEGVKKVPTLFDFKRTPNPTKDMQQLAAYAKCGGMEYIKQLVVIPVNDKTKQGFSKPIVTDKIDEYYTMFKQARADFKLRFSV